MERAYSQGETGPGIAGNGETLSTYMERFEDEYTVEHTSEPVTYRTIQDTELLNVGVRHTVPFYHEHEDLFADVIGDADAVVLEQPLRQEVEDGAFYGRLVDAARVDGTEVYVEDPNDMVHDTTETVQPLTGAGIAGGGVVASQELLGSGVLEAAPEIGAVGALAAGAYIAAGSRLGAVVETVYGIKRRNRMDTPLYDRAGYGPHDHRNVVIADGIDTICRETDHEAVAAFHGVAHRSSIDHYLDDRMARARKKALYAPFTGSGGAGGTDTEGVAYGDRSNTS